MNCCSLIKAKVWLTYLLLAPKLSFFDPRRRPEHECSTHPVQFARSAPVRDNIGDNDRHKDSVTIHTHSQDSRDGSFLQIFVLCGWADNKISPWRRRMSKYLCASNRKQKITQNHRQIFAAPHWSSLLETRVAETFIFSTWWIEKMRKLVMHLTKSFD